MVTHGNGVQCLIQMRTPCPPELYVVGRNSRTSAIAASVTATPFFPHAKPIPTVSILTQGSIRRPNVGRGRVGICYFAGVRRNPSRTGGTGLRCSTTRVATCDNHTEVVFGIPPAYIHGDGVLHSCDSPRSLSQWARNCVLHVRRTDSPLGPTGAIRCVFRMVRLGRSHRSRRPSRQRRTAAEQVALNRSSVRWWRRLTRYRLRTIFIGLLHCWTRYLAGLDNLVIVWLNSTNVTADGVRRLQRAIPDCDIRWRPGPAPW